MRRLIFAAFLLLAAIPAHAVITVESVLSPAWVERANGRREPLAVGMQLQNREKVHTGDGGRALLKVSEGSAIKLGEGATLGVDDLLEKKDEKGGLVAASLDVVRGAFRFTTGLLGQSPAQRDVRVKVNNITAGIRGTDVWGKSEQDRDIICLLEGRITVAHGTAQFAMTEPNSFYIAPRKGQAKPPSPVDPQQVREWSAETEIDPRTGAARAGGQVAIVVISADDERSATAARDKLRDAGFPGTLAQSATGYDVRIESLSDSVEASALVERLRRLGYTQARPAR